MSWGKSCKGQQTDWNTSWTYDGRVDDTLVEKAEGAEIVLETVVSDCL